MPYGPSQFQSTVIKPYYKGDGFKPLQDALEDALKNAFEDTLKDALEKNYN